MLVHTGRKDISAIADSIWYPLWDIGIKLGHAVRTEKEALALATDDLQSATALLSARLVVGDPDMAASLAAAAAKDWARNARARLHQLAASVEARHQRYGEVAYLLEPDLKEGRGGLRDVHALHWAEAGRPGLLDDDREALAHAYSPLLAIRVELHRRTGNRSDKLVLQEQDALAEDLGFDNADSLMSTMADAARTIAWSSDEIWDQIRSWVQGPPSRHAVGERSLANGVILRDRVVELDGEGAVSGVRVLQVAAAAAEAHTRIGRRTLDRLAAGATDLPTPWPPEALAALVALLRSGHHAIPVLEALDRRNLLSRFIPEWSAVRCKPQRNSYHRFTVDRHLVEAAARAAELAATVRRPDLLVLAGLFHDIGKGSPGDHTEAGVAILATLGPRIGLAERDVETLKSLVQHHLLLAEVATRRDLDDESTIDGVVKIVGDIDTLELLVALTEADSIATGPAAWSEWKAGLVHELASRVERRLRGSESDHDTFPAARDLEIVEQARSVRDLVVSASRNDLIIAAPDQPGLFSRVAGTLTLAGLDVLAARAWTSDDGIALETFRVQPSLDRPVDWEKFEQDLRAVIAGRLSLDARITQRARDYGIAQPQGDVAAQVVAHSDASGTATVVEVHAPDRIGTLYRITRALAELALDIRHAKVATVGDAVVDTFYVLDRDGQKISDDHVRELERAVLLELSRI